MAGEHPRKRAAAIVNDEETTTNLIGLSLRITLGCSSSSTRFGDASRTDYTGSLGLVWLLASKQPNERQRVHCRLYGECQSVRQRRIIRQVHRSGGGGARDDG